MHGLVEDGAMRSLLAVLPLVLLASASTSACVDVSAGKGTTSTAGSGPDAGDAGAVVTLQGAGCGTDAATGVTLCLAVSVCPDVIIDADLWPGCGFRLGPAGFDLQCVCDTQLCPIGTPLTCEQIQPLLDAQSQLAVCASAGDGRCITPASSTSGGAASTCDRACAQGCYGENGCLEGCGCAG